MKRSLIEVILLSLLMVSCADKSTVIEKPNVLFVALDDLNDWTGYMGGHPQGRTPNIDKFANNSVYFTHAYCSNPACNPSRTSIMTGYSPHTSGVYSNYQDWREVIPERTTIGEYFRDNGYYSAGAGKIFHYSMIDSACWDEYWPSQRNNMPRDYMPKRSPEGTVNMPVFEDMYKAFDWDALDIPDSLMGDYKSVRWVSQNLQREHDKPFFLACGIYRPHLPWYVPEKYFNQYPLDSVQLPLVLQNDLDDVSDRARDIAHRAGNYHKHVTEAGLWKDAVRGYLASINFADAMFGMLMDNLAKSPYADNTIVVLWSDHGWQLGEKEHWRKFALWENVVRTNLIIYVPENLKGFINPPDRGACDRVVSLQDIYPTLVDLCGLPQRDDIDGRSLVPLLKDKSTEWDYPAITSYDFGEFSIRNERWRYTIYIDGSEELYDHDNDPEEWYNLAEKEGYGDVLQKMRSYIPANPAPLIKTSLKLLPYQTPPFASKEEYQYWLDNDKSYPKLIEKYWNK